MNSSTYFGDSDSSTEAFCPAPPPPPPPPAFGQVPALRIATVENARNQFQAAGNDAYEPPAAIQNAMMTKDKKPFTYTPGMGGKLDLSLIRSPRMARRVAKNANDEGIEGPPKSATEPRAAPGQTGANLFVQPQVAVPVFPASMPLQPSLTRTVVNNINYPQNSSYEKQPEMPKNVIRVETKMTPSSPPGGMESPTTPPHVSLAKAPTPWMLNRNKSQEELPEWAKRPSRSSDSTPESPLSPPIYVQTTQQSPPPPPLRNPSPQPPFSNQRQVQRPTNHQEQVAPMMFEDRPSVFSAKNQTAGHHQFKDSGPGHHQSRWYQPSPQQNQSPAQVQVQQSRPQLQQSGGGYVIPVIVEGKESKTSGGISPTPTQNQMRVMPSDNQTQRGNMQRNQVYHQPEPAPIQSKSFRVLQKITSTDTPDEVDGEQVRKLQLTEDDRSLMNKFKEHVDGENFLHQEEDPRYRGSAIPSRAFRYLQNMTDGGEMTTNTGPRPSSALNKKQNRNSKSFDEVQANLPPSEQKVLEPKKYTGSAIPSRSFRILQAMTSPESIAMQENQQADFTLQTENSMSVNQPVFFPSPFSPSKNQWAYIKPYNAPNAYCNYGDAFQCSIRNQSLNAHRNLHTFQEPSKNFSTPQTKSPKDVSNAPVKFPGNPLRRNSWRGSHPRKSQAKFSSTHFSDEEISESSDSASESDSSDSYVAYSTGPKTRNNVSSESENSDKTDVTTVSVSLPLKLRFSVSEDNEDVTTVIVGDSTVKPDKTSDFAEDESKMEVEFTVKNPQTEGKVDLEENRQNSREETDDDDSGVTSDMSRMISEVDTDSECCGSRRRMNKFQRTQTHSRLFKLLNSEQTRKNRLSLPLEMRNLNDDENYGSNSSSCLTSPECSPVTEKPWKKLHNQSFKCGDDSYYQTWKSPESKEKSGFVSTLNYGMIGKRRDNLGNRINILCPRVKSSKNVPQVLTSEKKSQMSFVQNPLKNNRC